jgi:hypothetical protein
LSGCPTPVAVCAAHFTLAYLGRDVLPGGIVDDHLGDGFEFRGISSVVEFEDYWVLLSAIYAGVTQKVVINLKRLLTPESIPAFGVPLFEITMLAVITLSPTLFETVGAPRCLTVPRLLSCGECVRVFFNLAASTPFHLLARKTQALITPGKTGFCQWVAERVAEARNDGRLVGLEPTTS